MTKKQQVIEELMQGNSFAYPMEIKKKLSRKSLNIILFYYNIGKTNGSSNKHIIENIIHIG